MRRKRGAGCVELRGVPIVRLTNVLLTSALGLFLVPAAAAETRMELERVSSRLILGDHSIVEVVASLSGIAGKGVYQSGFVRIGDTVYAISATDERCRTLDLSISSAKTQVLVRADWEFAAAGLPVPHTVTIGEETYRLFWGETPFAPAAKKRAVEAVRKLPSPFLSALRLLWGLAELNEEGIPFGLLHLAPLFDEPAPMVTILDRIPLTLNEVEELTREAERHEPKPFTSTARPAPGGTRDTVERTASRLHLGDDSMVEIVGTTPSSGGSASYESAFFRIGGTAYTAASSRRCGIHELRISGAKTELVIRTDSEFDKDHLPVPQTIAIGSETYRFLQGDAPGVTPARKKAIEAVGKLPTPFVSALLQLWGLAELGEEGVPFGLLQLAPLFGEPAPMATVLDRNPLTPKEVENLAREAAVVK